MYRIHPGSGRHGERGTLYEWLAGGGVCPISSTLFLFLFRPVYRHIDRPVLFVDPSCSFHGVFLNLMVHGLADINQDAKIRKEGGVRTTEKGAHGQGGGNTKVGDTDATTSTMAMEIAVSGHQPNRGGSNIRNKGGQEFEQ